MNKLSPFSNLAKFISKSSDNGPVSVEKLCMEDCKPLCRCGPDLCVCTVSQNSKDGPKEYKVSFIHNNLIITESFIKKKKRRIVCKYCIISYCKIGFFKR